MSMLDWNGGMDYAISKNNTFPRNNTRLYCVAICLLTYSASSALYWPSFMQPPRSCRGQRSHAYLISFKGCDTAS